MRRPARTLPDGYDRIGPFHPYVIWAGVILLDLAIIAAGLALLAMLGDSIEDAIWPGGVDWIEAL